MIIIYTVCKYVQHKWPFKNCKHGTQVRYITLSNISKTILPYHNCGSISKIAQLLLFDTKYLYMFQKFPFYIKPVHIIVISFGLSIMSFYFYIFCVTVNVFE